MTLAREPGVGTEPAVTDLAGRLACEELLLASYRLVDTGRAADVADLFTEDAVFEAGPGLRLEGHDQISRTFAARERNTERHTRHVISNVSVRVTGESDAEATAVITLYVLDRDAAEGGRGAVPPRLVADCHDRYRRENGEWRIAGRRLDVFAGSP